MGELAEEIWAASSGDLLPVRRLSGPPRPPGRRLRITLPGWLASLDHLVVGPTGVWVVESGQRRRRLAVGGGDGTPAGTLRELRWQAGAIAEVLDGGAGIPVRGLLCLEDGWSGPPRSLQGIGVAAPRQLADVVRHGSKVAPDEVELATARLLEVLRPAA